MSVILAKNNKIYSRDWDGDKREYIKELIKNEHILFFSKDDVLIEEGFTLRNYFETVKAYPNLQLLDGFFPSYLEEYEKVKNIKVPDEKLDLEYLAVSKYFEKKVNVLKRPMDNDERSPKTKKRFDRWANMYKYDPDCDVESGSVFHGFGFPDPEDESLKDWPTDDLVPYGLSFSSIGELLDYEIRIEPDMLAIQDESVYPAQFKFDNFYSKDNSWDLISLIKEVIWELSWHGTPAKRDRTVAEIMERKEESLVHPEDCIPFEDLFDDEDK